MIRRYFCGMPKEHSCIAFPITSRSTRALCHYVTRTQHSVVTPSSSLYNAVDSGSWLVCGWVLPAAEQYEACHIHPKFNPVLPRDQRIRRASSNLAIRSRQRSYDRFQHPSRGFSAMEGTVARRDAKTLVRIGMSGSRWSHASVFHGGRPFVLLARGPGVSYI
ncbi:hypothetical protein BD311DRAFT_174911 [Dichomitus squalens]|uniref:Uncharacterized protein n=1 Tax=Dichomitus squalens TaxID=114155 RepID=A0A4Q9MSJ4_9APHY|nr:hypothetical protein BD311DRAFT_174911 [Dichomitus squalens]